MWLNFVIVKLMVPIIGSYDCECGALRQTRFVLLDIVLFVR